MRFVDREYHCKRYRTRMDKLQVRIGQPVPWQNLALVIEPHYSKAEICGKYNSLITNPFMQWYDMSDIAMKDTLYETASMRVFVRLVLDRLIPYHTTITNFWHLAEHYDLAQKITDLVSEDH